MNSLWWLIAVFIGTAVLKHRRMAIAITNIHRSTGGASSLVAVRPLHSPFFKLKIIPPKVLCGSDSACLTVYSFVSPSWLCNASKAITIKHNRITNRLQVPPALCCCTVNGRTFLTFSQFGSNNTLTLQFGSKFLYYGDLLACTAPNKCSTKCP